MKHHFEKCQEKIEAGKGFKGEECVEELSPWLLFPLLLSQSTSCTAPKPAPRPRSSLNCANFPLPQISLP
ncbi:hypothetical protein B0H16DRAFT_1587362 [Mycena metata]|uniref:Ubiquinol-cytochrome C reductase hinge domain-containing protein n=1 Tax=Mycena metata TaxID=1033252 RepID=A0AAD7MSW1_9AGAR|nr:hypothetical protein B0H16DRAFT_1587362 [Mycena metata]